MKPNSTTRRRRIDTEIILKKFQKDWTSGEYDPGMTFTFKDSEVEVLEVLQEEVDNIDHEAVKRQVAAAEDAQYQKEKKTAPATQTGKQGQQIP